MNNLCPAFFILIYTTFSCGHTNNEVTSSENFIVPNIEVLEIDKIYNYNIPHTTSDNYILICNIASNFLDPKMDSIRQIKGRALATVLASHVQVEIDSGYLDPHYKATIILINQLKLLGYLVYQPDIHPFIKLSHYACKGYFKHIYNRLSNEWYFFWTILLLAILFAFSALVAFKVIPWKRRKLYNIFLLSVIIVIGSLTIVFVNTCDECITQDTFYFIRFRNT